MTPRVFVALGAALLVLRLPSVMQPMGADQGLYAYVGERILAGDVPYRDAWDQKPPAIHYTYAALRALWSGDGAVAAADIAAAAGVGWLLYRLGSAAAGPSAGAGAGLLFLLLSNPSFTRLAGVRLRGQCETFIAVAVTAALLLLVADRRRSGARVLSAGALFGLAFAYKYNAGVYALVGVLGLLLTGGLRPGHLWRLAAGFSIPLVLLLGLFASTGTLDDAYDATIAYNLRYSSETYSGPGEIVRYLFTFPVERARVDALWTVGGAGALILLLASGRDRLRLLAPLWIAAACVSIAVNGSRSLPQYFVQANPALALAAGWGAMVVWQWLRGSLSVRTARLAALAVCSVTAVAVWRVNQFPKLADQTWFDAKRVIGWVDRETYLARFADERKYSAGAMRQLAGYMQAHSTPSDTVYVFGFSAGAYVTADRESASRFFWSRPVIVGFNGHKSGYGVDGLLDALRQRPPAVVALQRHDWAPDVANSAEFFLSTPKLASWLHAGYERDVGSEEFEVWRRRAAAP